MPTDVSSFATRPASNAARFTTTTSRRFRSRAAPGPPTTMRRSGSAWRTASRRTCSRLGLMASGMNWSQALVTILLGNTIVLVPILLNSHPGTKYGIPFPVFARAAYGTIGSNLPALMRALVACGWFGIQAWIGGEALQTFFAASCRVGRSCSATDSPATRRPSGCRSCSSGVSTSSSSTAGWICCASVENWAAPFVLVMTAALLVWAVREANGLGPLLAQPGKAAHVRRVPARCSSRR